MIHLTKEQILLMHSLCISQTGGADGIRDDGLLDLAVNSPYQSFGGIDLYPSIQTKAAQICFSLINNHPFVDGNKRIGILVMLTILELNGITVETSDDALISLGLSVAQGNTNSDAIAEWIIANTKS
mgnify:CR=1 FL=1